MFPHLSRSRWLTRSYFINISRIFYTRLFTSPGMLSLTYFRVQLEPFQVKWTEIWSRLRARSTFQMDIPSTCLYDNLTGIRETLLAAHFPQYAIKWTNLKFHNYWRVRHDSISFIQARHGIVRPYLQCCVRILYTILVLFLFYWRGLDNEIVSTVSYTT